MSKLSQLKKKWNWESSSIRCDNCLHFKRDMTFLVNSLPRIDPARCKLGGFHTRPNSICDNWTDKDTKLGCTK